MTDSLSVSGGGDGGDGDTTNLNAQVLQSLTRLANTLAKLDETSYHDADNANNEQLIEEKVAALNISDNDSAERVAAVSQTEQSQDTAATSTLTKLPTIPISHWRALPQNVQSAYQLLNDGATYIHATSTKYTLVGKVDTQEGSNLAVELRKGAELIGTGTLLLYSKQYGSSRSLKHYIKQYSRAIIASLISLIKSFEDGLSQGQANDGNNIGAQKTGAVWAACDKLTNTLPKGNRAAMRRKLMVWIKDCNESIEEFEEVLELGPRDDNSDNEEEEEMMDEEQYTEKEMSVARASVNLMKCSKNLLTLVLKTCECVGEYVDKIPTSDDTAASEDNDTTQQQQVNDKKRQEILQWISNLHEMARTVGEGVTNVGILLYPPLDNATASEEEIQQWQEKKPKAMSLDVDEVSSTIPSLGKTTMGIQLEHQLCALAECVLMVHDAQLPTSGEKFDDCISSDVRLGSERMRIALNKRCKEVEEALASWQP